MAQALPFILMAASTVMSMKAGNDAAAASAAQGRAQQTESNYEAAAMRQRAGQERASSQISAINERKRANYVGSALQARAAASGASASDPTTVKLQSDIAGEGEYRALTQLYSGDVTAQSLETQANLKEFEGANAATAGNAAGRIYQQRALATALENSASMFSKYGGKGPPPLYDGRQGPLPGISAQNYSDSVIGYG